MQNNAIFGFENTLSAWFSPIKISPSISRVKVWTELQMFEEKEFFKATLSASLSMNINCLLFSCGSYWQSNKIFFNIFIMLFK